MFGDYLTKKFIKMPNNILQSVSLKKSILEAWTLISHDVIKKLYDTIPNRIFDTIRANGGFTKY
jgi:hypothetical protein